MKRCWGRKNSRQLERNKNHFLLKRNDITLHSSASNNDFQSICFLSSAIRINRPLKPAATRRKLVLDPGRIPEQTNLNTTLARERPISTAPPWQLLRKCFLRLFSPSLDIRFHGKEQICLLESRYFLFSLLSSDVARSSVNLSFV